MKKRIILILSVMLFALSAGSARVTAAELLLPADGTGVDEDLLSPESSDKEEEVENIEDTSDAADVISADETGMAADEDLSADDDLSADAEEVGPSKAAKAVKAGNTVLDLKEDVAHLGGFPVAEEADPDKKGASQADAAAARAKIDGAIAAFKEEADLSGYRLGPDEVRREIAGVLNANPAYFTVEGASVDVKEDDGFVSTVRFEYVRDAGDRSSKYDAAVKKIISGIRSNWSDEAKLMYLHDWLVTHTQYDLTYSRYSAYDAIVDHSAVCQGYALAYEDLVQHAGISAYFVSSRENNHAWNLVKVGGKKYYVDCTWDDPITSGRSGVCHCYRMKCEHSNFLCSQSQMKDLGHKGSDWTCEGSNISGKYNNKAYDDAPWKRDGNSAAAITESGRIILIENSGGIMSVFEYEPQSGSEVGYPGDLSYYSSAAIAGGKVYISDTDTLYRLDRSAGKLITVYKLTASEKKKGSIYGIEGTGSKVRYDLGTGWTDEEYVSSGKYDTAKEKVVKSLTLDRTSIEFTEAGGTAKIKARVVPKSAGVRWSSENPYIATVKDGLIEAVGEGETVITAEAGDLTATCTVTVGSVIRLNKNKMTLFAGASEKLIPTFINPEEGPWARLYWYSWEEHVATVDDDGTVHAVSPGNATIVVSGFGGSATCAVTVKGTKPDKPGNVHAENTAKGIKITWDPSEGAGGYAISRSVGGTSYKQIAKITGCSYIDKGASKNGKKYSYKVKACRTSKGKNYTSAFSKAVTLYRLSPSAIKSASNSSSKALTLKWKKNSKCSGYLIQYDTDKKFTDAVTLKVSSAKTLSKKIKGLGKKKTYYVRVCPYKNVNGKNYTGAWTKYKKGIKIKK